MFSGKYQPAECHRFQFISICFICLSQKVSETLERTKKWKDKILRWREDLRESAKESRNFPGIVWGKGQSFIV